MKTRTAFFALMILPFSNSSGQNLTVWKDSAMTPIYNKATQKVYYNKFDKKGLFKIYRSDLNGKNEELLTSSIWSNELQQFAEEVSPNGDFIFCVIEKSERVKENGHKRKAIDAVPGYGAYSDIWFLKSKDQKAGLLYAPPNNYDFAITHMALSNDGKILAWSERIKRPKLFDANLMAGTYVLKIADVVYDSIPKLENIRTLNPGDKASAMEVESISPDNKYLFLYSTFETRNLLNTPIYRYEIKTGKMTRLTKESFAQCPTVTPNGKSVVYMTGRDCDIFPFSLQGADWWITDTLGKTHTRLTFMNKKGHPQSVNKYRLAGTLTMIDDNSFIGGVQRKPFGLDGYLVKVVF